MDRVASSLARIASTEAMIGAWAHVAVADAYEQAHRRDEEALRGPLHGVPVGVKDVIPSFGAPIGYGTARGGSVYPPRDAACVAALRANGGVILGKTATTEFTLLAPDSTRNPHDPSRTAGQSSGGSAAAVSSGSVALAVGTQIGGSITRPAAYCGVVGYKPSYGLIPQSGTFSLSPSLDTVGVFAGSVREAGILSRALGALPSCGRLDGGPPRPRLGLCRTDAWDLADASVIERIEQVLALVRDEGAIVGGASVSRRLNDAPAITGVIVRYEGSRALRSHLADDREMSETVSEFLREARSLSPTEYVGSLAQAGQVRRDFRKLMDPFDALVTLSTLSEAPPFGHPDPDRTLNSAWTLVRAPTLNLPVGTGANGLPLGVQLIGAPFDDSMLLACAEWVEERVRSMLG